MFRLTVRRTLCRAGAAAACLFLSALPAADQAPEQPAADGPAAAAPLETHRATRAEQAAEEQAAAADVPAGRKAFTPAHLRLQAKVKLFQATAPAYEQGGTLWVQFGDAAPVALEVDTAPRAFAAIESTDQALELCDCLTWGIRLTNAKDYQNLLELYKTIGEQPVEPAGKAAPAWRYTVTATRVPEDGGFLVAFTAIVLPRGMGAAVQVGRFAFQVSAKGEVQAAEPELYFSGPTLNWQTAMGAADDPSAIEQFQREQKWREDRRNLLLDVMFNRYSPVLAAAAAARYPAHEIIADPAVKATAPATPADRGLGGDASGVGGGVGAGFATSGVDPAGWNEFDSPPPPAVVPGTPAAVADHLDRTLNAVVQSFQVRPPLFATADGVTPSMIGPDSAPQIQPEPTIAGAAAPLAVPTAEMLADPTNPFPDVTNEMPNAPPPGDPWPVNDAALNAPMQNMPAVVDLPPQKQEQTQPGQQNQSLFVNWGWDNDINKQQQVEVNDNPPVVNAPPEPEMQEKVPQAEVGTVVADEPQAANPPPSAPINNDCPDDTLPQTDEPAAQAGQQMQGGHMDGCATAAEEDTF